MASLDDCYNIFDLREAARKRLPRGVFEFFDRGTEDEVALANNRAGFNSPLPASIPFTKITYCLLPKRRLSRI